MKLRLVRYDGCAFLLCGDGSICIATAEVLSRLLLKFSTPEIFTGNDGTWSPLYRDMDEFPGKTLAYVSDEGHLTLTSQWVTETVNRKPNYLSASAYAKKNHYSREHIIRLANRGELSGAVKLGHQWFIPEDTPCPTKRSRLSHIIRTTHATQASSHASPAEPEHP